MVNAALIGVKKEHLAECPICGSEAVHFSITGRDRQLLVSEENFEYSRCEGCGVLFESLRPVQAEIGKFYTEGYGPYSGLAKPKPRLPPRFDRLANQLAAWILNHAAFNARIQEFYKRLEAKPLFLDFGCGSGGFLDRARKAGCQTIGMDFSEQALREVARRGHRALSISDTDWDKIEDGTVGFVRMNHVVEHLYDPRAVMRRIYAKMRPGAGLHLATPNADSEDVRTYRECWWGLDCPRHIVIFNAAALSAVFREAGFAEIETLQEPLAKDALRSWIYRRIDDGLEPKQDVAALANDGLLNLRFSFPSRAAAKAGMADRFHLLATKVALS